MADTALAADPEVSRSLFDREITAYRAREAVYLARGWWLVSATFPEVFVVMGTPNARPVMVPYGVLIDFTGYDLVAPSVKLANPFTKQPLTAAETSQIASAVNGQPNLRYVLPRIRGVSGPPGAETIDVQDLLQFAPNDPDAIPFVCLSGTREFHDHPAHSNEPWLAVRGTGEGNLYYLLDTISKYGTEAIGGQQVQFQISTVLAAVQP